MRHAAVVVGLGSLGWALCAATMGFGMALLGLQTALVVHALAAPVFFSAISFVYFRRFAYTTPIVTACAFLGVVVFMDVFVVAMLVQRSFAMFGSFIGTWLPFVLIFGSTLLTGLLVGAREVSEVQPPQDPRPSSGCRTKQQRTASGSIDLTGIDRRSYLTRW